MALHRHDTLPLFYLIAIIISAACAVFFLVSAFSHEVATSPATSKLAKSISENLIVKPATPTPSPTAKPYPPSGYHCIKLPILMYHHVEPLSQAKQEGHAPLTVDSSIFASQMQYLADRGYAPIQLKDLASFFDAGKALPAKAIILTFDDGYVDFHDFAVPVLASHNFVSDLFVPTGLVENPGYLSWSQIKEDSGRGVSVDHHTWSHANVAQVNDEFFHRELDIATQQLNDHGYGPVKIFAYPYGTHNGRDISELAKRGFSIAVTTEAGQIQCKEDRLALHRTRVGNAPLKSYGL